MARSIWLSLVALFALGGAVSAAPVNIVTNGSFELGNLGIGSFQGWQTSLGDTSTFVDSSGQTGTHFGQASDGLWATYFGTTAADGHSSIMQILSTTGNQSYLLSFDLANDNGGLPALNSFVVSLGAATPLALTNSVNQNFVHYQFAFAASSSTMLLKFLGSNDNGYFELDNVTVAATPEPSTAALLFGGVLSVGLALRNKIGGRLRPVSD